MIQRKILSVVRFFPEFGRAASSYTPILGGKARLRIAIRLPNRVPRADHPVLVSYRTYVTYLKSKESTGGAPPALVERVWRTRENNCIIGVIARKQRLASSWAISSWMVFHINRSPWHFLNGAVGDVEVIGTSAPMKLRNWMLL